MSEFNTYTTAELDTYRKELRQDCLFGRGRFSRSSDWRAMATMLEEGIEYCDETYGEHDEKRVVQAEVYREMQERSNPGYSRDGSEEEAPGKPSGNGQGTGSVDRKGMASDKQKEFLEALLEGRTDEIAQKARARVDSVSGYVNKDTASALIEKLMEAAPGIVAWKERMSGKQRDLLIKLWVERGVNENVATVVMTKTWLKTDKDQASRMIDRAFAAAKGRTATVRTKAEEGFYEVGDKVIKVQRGVTSGNLFAKLLVVDPELAKGFEWVYTPGLITETIGAKALTKERAAQLGQELKLYGYCFKCGRELTDEESIERGIGRICWDKI